MPQANEVLILGEKIAQHFPPAIADYFLPQNFENNKDVLDTFNAMIQKDWLSEIESDAYRHLPFGLPLAICFVLARREPSSPEVNKSHRSAFSESRREKKKYRMRIVSDEYKKGGGELLNRAFRAYKEYTKFASGPMKSYSEKEFMKEKYDEMAAWFEDASANLIEYPFINTLSFKAQAEYLYTDIGYHTFDIIINKFKKDVTSIVGKFPRPLTDGTFALQSGVDEVKLSVENDSVVAYTSRSVGKEKKVETMVERLDGDFRAAAKTEAGKMKLVNELIEQKVFTPLAHRLDADDQQLFEIIYNMFSVSDMGPKEVDIKYLTESLGKRPSERDYREVLKRVHKLSTYRVQRLKIDETTLEFSDPELISVTYRLKNAKNLEGVDEEHTSLAEGSRRKSIVDLIDEINESIEDESMRYKFSSVVMSIEPTSMTKGYIMDNANQIWYISADNANLSNQTRSMLRLLLSRRIDLFTENGGDGGGTDKLSYEYFIEHLQIDPRLRKSRLEALLNEHLNSLCGEGLLLKEYKLLSSSRAVSLSFNPFNEKEKEQYRIN